MLYNKNLVYDQNFCEHIVKKEAKIKRRTLCNDSKWRFKKC